VRASTGTALHPSQGRGSRAESTCLQETALRCRVSRVLYLLGETTTWYCYTGLPHTQGRPSSRATRNETVQSCATRVPCPHCTARRCATTVKKAVAPAPHQDAIGLLRSKLTCQSERLQRRRGWLTQGASAFGAELGALGEHRPAPLVLTQPSNLHAATTQSKR
jgi:hypothetical protein